MNLGDIEYLLEDVEDIGGLNILAEDIFAVLDTESLARTCAFLIIVRGWEVEDIARISGIPIEVFEDWLKEKPTVRVNGKTYKLEGENG